MDNVGNAPIDLIVQKYVKLLLTYSRDTAFSSDDEYLQLLEGIFHLFFLILESKELLARNLLSIEINLTTKQLDPVSKLYDGISSLHKQLQNLLDCKLKCCKEALETKDNINNDQNESKSNDNNDNNDNKNENKSNDENEKANDKSKGYMPRIERLCSRLGLTAKEKVAFQYIVLNNIGIQFPSNQRSFDGRGVLRSMAVIADMSSREVLNFLSPKRHHIKDGLFECTDDALSYEFSSMSFKMSKETLSALMGAELTAEQFLMVDNTTLGELLAEEGINASMLPTDGGDHRKREDSLDGLSDLGDDELMKLLKDTDPNKNSKGKGNTNKTGDVFELIKTMKDMEKSDAGIKSGSGDVDVSTVGNENKSNENDLDMGGVVGAGSGGNGNGGSIEAYTDNLDYLQDHFKVIELRIKTFQSSLEEKDSYKFQAKNQKTTLRELKSQEKQAYKKCIARIEKRMSSFVPRMEKLVKIRNLDEFEKWVVLTLIGCVLSVNVIKAAGLTGRYRDALSVGDMLAIHCPNLRNQIEYRKYFYKTATLVRENIIKIHEPKYLNQSDLMHSLLEIDRRMVDYVVALDTEFGALVEGSALFSPNVSLNQVILAKETKELILDTISGMEEFRKTIDKFDIGGGNSDNNNNTSSSLGGTGSASGIVILFHGISGTGKTMMAHAIANHLERKLLLINFPSLQNGDKTEELLNMTFREAKIQNAIVFFDECEALFESRELRGNKIVNISLNIIEKYDDLIILATNRPFDLDEAMHRRIQLAVEFPSPNVHLREKIWQTHLNFTSKKNNDNESNNNDNSVVELSDNVDLYKISLEFELTGGFIRNSVLTALKMAMLKHKKESLKKRKEDKNNIVDELSMSGKIIINQNDLLTACRQQIIGQLQLSGFSRRVVPKKCLSDIILEEKDSDIVNEIILRNKSGKVLTGQWGFNFEFDGSCILITGPSGVGKTTLAEVIAYECGKPMKVLTVAELLHVHRISLRAMNNSAVDTTFGDLNSGALVVIENSELLFNISGHHVDEAIGYLLFQLRRVSTMFIFIMQGELHTGNVLSMTPVQKSLFKHFHFWIQLKSPTKDLRKELWMKMIPKQTPVNKYEQEIMINGIHSVRMNAIDDDENDDNENQNEEKNGDDDNNNFSYKLRFKQSDIDFDELSHKFDKFVHKDIERTIVKACGNACLRKESKERYLQMKDLVEAGDVLEKRMENSGLRAGFHHMYT